MWYAKMYFSENREIFQYDSLGTQGVPNVQRELPFLESLLSFQELDCAEVTPLLQCIAEDWSRFIAEDDRGALESAMKKLGELASVHIYFQLLYVHCYYRQTAIFIRNDRGSAEDAKLLDELHQLPEQLPLYQQQVQRFFDLVLDVDSAGREPQAQAAKNYFHDSPKDPGLFSFRPIPLSFEPVEPGRCSPVLYSSGIRDMIDYSLRSCVERNITVRRCKNCGRWFPPSGLFQEESRSVGRSGLSNSGRRSGRMTRSSRLTARNTSGALRGSRPGAYPMRISTLGANKPERRKRNATRGPSPWRTSSGG